MPLVNISILKGKSPEYKKAIANSINSAVIETMGFPDDDRYQIINEVESDCLEYQGRDSDRVMMFLIMRAGRSNKEKQEFYKKAVENLSLELKSKPFEQLTQTVLLLMVFIDNSPKVRLINSVGKAINTTSEL